MTNEPLTPDQEQAFAAIMADEFSTDAVVRLGQALHGCLYTTTALRMLAAHQRLSLDDTEGAQLLDTLAHLFAKFEATQV
jgi:hypothetical protein